MTMKAAISIIFGFNVFFCLPTITVTGHYMRNIHHVLPISIIGLITGVFYFVLYMIRDELKLKSIFVFELVFLALFATIFGMNTNSYPKNGWCDSRECIVLFVLILFNGIQFFCCVIVILCMLFVILRGNRVYNDYYV